jgi:hypothetical protein
MVDRATFMFVQCYEAGSIIIRAGDPYQHVCPFLKNFKIMRWIASTGAN